MKRAQTTLFLAVGVLAGGLLTFAGTHVVSAQEPRYRVLMLHGSWTAQYLQNLLNSEASKGYFLREDESATNGTIIFERR